MSHGRASCRDSGATLLNTELMNLYARRVMVLATIRELESWKRAMTVPGEQRGASSLEISAKPCNLTSCRSA